MTSSLIDAVPEAPVDTKQYARKDGDWAEVDASVLDHNSLNGLNNGDYKHWTAVEKAAIAINSSAPASTITIDASGNILLSGDLSVQGTNTILDTQTVTIEDKNIELAKVTTPTDITADGGGITLKGATDKTIAWSTTDDRWHFNQGIEIDSGDIVIDAGGSLLINSKNVEDHIDSILNPHSVTKAQVGLGNVDNTSDADKPVSTAQQAALDAKTHNSLQDLNVGDYQHFTAVEKASFSIDPSAPAGSISIDSSGNVTIAADFIVSGTTTTLNTATLEVEDKNIEIAKVTTPTDVTADGGGITLKGTTDKTIQWLNADDRWHFNQGIEIDTGDLIVETGNLGVGVIDPDAPLEIFYAGTQLKLSFDATDTTTFGVDTSGILTIIPSGAATSFADKNIINVGDIALDSISSDGSAITIGSTPSIVLTDGTAIAVTLGNDAGDDFAIDSTSFVVEGDGGNIGIGTNAPDIMGWGSAAGLITSIKSQIADKPVILELVTITPTLTNYMGRLVLGDSTTGKYTSVSGYRDSQDGYVGLKIQTFGAVRNDNAVVVDSSGNVGIGTSSPLGKLHVKSGSAGTISPSVNADDLIVENSGTAGISIFAPDANDTQIIFGNNTGDANAYLQWDYDGDTNGLMTLGTLKTGAQLRFFVDNASEVMRIDSSGGVFVNSLKSGATQAGAGAAANELWVTSSHATLPDNVVMIGV